MNSVNHKKEYLTDNKKTVSDFFKNNSERHYTVENVIEKLDSEGISIPKSTLYRIIGSLCRSGLLKRYESGSENCFVYQYANFDDSCIDHFHLKCSECGNLIHLECDKMNEIKEHIMKEHGFMIGGAGIINGICGKCLNKGNDEKID